MKIGYYDAQRMIYGLQGKIYYIEENEEECYYLRKLLQIPEKRDRAARRDFILGKKVKAGYELLWKRYCRAWPWN